MNCGICGGVIGTAGCTVEWRHPRPNMPQPCADCATLRARAEVAEAKLAEAERERIETDQSEAKMAEDAAEMAEDLTEARQARAAAEAREKALRDTLLRLEWCAPGNPLMDGNPPEPTRCPACHRTARVGHAADCWFRAALTARKNTAASGNRPGGPAAEVQGAPSPTSDTGGGASGTDHGRKST